VCIWQILTGNADVFITRLPARTNEYLQDTLIARRHWLAMKNNFKHFRQLFYSFCPPWPCVFWSKVFHE